MYDDFDFEAANYQDNLFAEENGYPQEEPYRPHGFWEDEYEIYRTSSDDGYGIDITTGKPLKTFDEWMEGFDQRLA